ncbi:MAG: TOBE domain-containing protein, partial [Actinomycetota bacterium]
SKPGPLSGGEAQRVALARALVIEPHVLLLDEPLSALDVSAKTRIRALLRSLLRGFDGVALVVTHDPIDAMTLGDRIVIIESGRVTHDATHEQVRVAPRTSYAADLVGVNLFAGRLEVTAEGAMIRTPTGDVACGTPDGVDEWVEGAMGILRPADVSLFLERPAGSARNVLPGPVTSVSVEGERARIGVGSSPPVVAEITLGSLRELGIAEGVTVWASFKALEVRVVLP